MIGKFSFGCEVKRVLQTDRSPKRVFVLGVYSSAVHARWVSPHGKLRVNALAVANEPYIFWRGDDAGKIIESISIPKELGQLEPPRSDFNGPSGLALDEFYLVPMGLRREDVWLCDLVPHSCANSDQMRAIEREYLPLMHEFALPAPSVPLLPRIICNNIRCSEIMDEIRQSQAGTLVLLGNEPIKWFLHQKTERWKSLSDFGTENYGTLQPVRLDDLNLRVLPLAHPRQSGRLGRFSRKWYELHQGWLRSERCRIL